MSFIENKVYLLYCTFMPICQYYRISFAFSKIYNMQIMTISKRVELFLILYPYAIYIYTYLLYRWLQQQRIELFVFLVVKLNSLFIVNLKTELSKFNCSGTNNVVYVDFHSKRGINLIKQHIERRRLRQSKSLFICS